VLLQPGESKSVTVEADPHLLARFQGKNGLGQWRITKGAYRIALGRSAVDLVSTAEATLTGRTFGR
jgi:beta-glucosidase